MRFLTWGERKEHMRFGMAEILCYPLWSRKWRGDPPWERFAALPFIVPMGFVNVIGAVTGLQWSTAISWLGWKDVCFRGWVEGLMATGKKS